MKKTDVLVMGGGPAGLAAADTAGKLGANVLLIDRNPRIGGQLIKQTHKFFGSESEYASLRGFEIAEILLNSINEQKNIEIMTNTSAVGIYEEDGIVVADQKDKIIKIKPKRIIVATGAGEKFLAFPNNDLPGIYGAGAVQTLMNEHGVKPGKSVLMIGAGNIGLIVSYQLVQAGIEVKAIIDASPNIGGYLVHASKIRRMGIPILTSHTIKTAHGSNCLEAATIVQLDENFAQIPGTETKIDVDVVCISVGLTPLTELLWQRGCEMRFISELGGYVPVRNQNLETTVQGIYVAGDVAGVEEASAAMVEGKLVGASVVESLGNSSKDIETIKQHAQNELEILRAGPMGEKIRNGLKQTS